MQRGAPQALSLSLSFSPFVLRTLTRLTSHEAGSVEACYRWTYVTIDGSIGQSSSCVTYVCVLVASRTHTHTVPSPSFVPLVAIEITQGVRGGRRGTATGSLTTRVVGLYSRNPVCIFIYEIVGRARKEGIGMDGD